MLTTVAAAITGAELADTIARQYDEKMREAAATVRGRRDPGLIVTCC
jgi:hypothetical protein